MTAKGKNIEIFSFSVSKKIAHEIDDLCNEIGYSTRSELIRDAIRLLIRSKYDIDKMKGKVEGVIVVLYKHSADREVFRLKHENMDIIKSYMHSDFNVKASKCCDVLFFSGDAESVRKIVYDFEGTKNVETVEVFFA